MKKKIDERLLIGTLSILLAICLEVFGCWAVKNGAGTESRTISVTIGGK